MGKPIRIIGRAANGATCEVVSVDSLEAARNRPITSELLRDQLGRLGGTHFELRELEANIIDQPMVPFSVLGLLRRDMVEQLSKSCPTSSREIADEGVLSQLRERLVEETSSVSCRRDERDGGSFDMYVLCRTIEQLRAACEFGAKNLYTEFADIREYSQAVEIARASSATIFLATPRIQKPDEMGIFRALSKHEADGILVRNYSGLEFFREREIPFVADFSMNVANELSAAFLMGKGTQRITASYDLNRDQLFDLVGAVVGDCVECVIHQHMPMFHMEHCVFCAVMSPGTNKTNCGRPCDHHQVELRDRIGMEHPLTADIGCRNTLYNATPQSSAEVVGDLRRYGSSPFSSGIASRKWRTNKQDDWSL